MSEPAEGRPEEVLRQGCEELERLTGRLEILLDDPPAKGWTETLQELVSLLVAHEDGTESPGLRKVASRDPGLHGRAALLRVDHQALTALARNLLAEARRCGQPGDLVPALWALTGRLREHVRATLELSEVVAR